MAVILVTRAEQGQIVYLCEDKKFADERNLIQSSTIVIYVSDEDLEKVTHTPEDLLDYVEYRLAGAGPFFC